MPRSNVIPFSETTDHVDVISQLEDWFSKANSDPSSKNIHTQLGIYFENVSSTLEILKEAGAEFNLREEVSFIAQVVDHIQKRFKNDATGNFIVLDDVDRVALLAALCDQITAAVGLGQMLGFDMSSAMQEVTKSHETMFDQHGRPIHNEARRLLEGPAYKAPSLDEYT